MNCLCVQKIAHFSVDVAEFGGTLTVQFTYPPTAGDEITLVNFNSSSGKLCVSERQNWRDFGRVCVCV